MRSLTKSESGRWEFDGDELVPGEEIELKLSGHWVRGYIDSNHHFVDASGEIEFIGLEGVPARYLGEGAPTSDLTEAYKQLATAAAEAALMLEELGRCRGTCIRLRDALFNIQSLNSSDRLSTQH